ncbi:MAG: hypothetical protein ACJAQZ_002583 [Planctomycetota bacterium]|jgi:hypothetical protein
MVGGTVTSRGACDTELRTSQTRCSPHLGSDAVSLGVNTVNLAEWTNAQAAHL